MTLKLKNRDLQSGQTDRPTAEEEDAPRRQESNWNVNAACVI